MLALSGLPYVFLYLCATTTSTVTISNHVQAMLAYPYDYALFHPNHHCRTCKFLKPPRSKHCPLCKACIQKQDHHCIWINNCVGRNNHLWFLLLLVAISILLLYGACLGYSILSSILQNRFVPPALTRGSLTSKKWFTRLSWSDYFDVWMWAISVNWQVGATTLLAVMAFPLSTGFLLYHVYLLWAGMTTNESSKWADWREDIADRLVYRAALDSLRGNDPNMPDARIEPVGSPWPTRSKWWVMLTRDGDQPTRSVHHSSDRTDDGHSLEPDRRWEKMHSISEMENIYDLGFLDNARDVLNRG
jgi:palmitoyltransferase